MLTATAVKSPCVHLMRASCNFEPGHARTVASTEKAKDTAGLAAEKNPASRIDL